MEVLRVRNVQEALLWLGGDGFRKHAVQEPSRDGPVLVLPEPLTTVYERPTERVLLCPRRDANPFFHLMESVWMLAGRRDPKWLDRYVKNFSARFAEDDGLQHGAYGWRWRQHFERDRPTDIMHPTSGTTLDQLHEAAELLRDRTTRRAVLAMWDPVVDLNLPSRDLPCNSHVYFRARSLGPVSDSPSSGTDSPRHVLDITVCNRSNDAVMGAYGANAVHMSVMGEVVAGLAGMRLGTYRQVSNNFHVYERDLKKIGGDPIWDDYSSMVAQPICGESDDPEQLRIEACHVLNDCEEFCEILGGDGDLEQFTPASAWFRDSVLPMQRAHDLYREGNIPMAIGGIVVEMPVMSDWCRAGVEWLERRMAR